MLPQHQKRREKKSTGASYKKWGEKDGGLHAFEGGAAFASEGAGGRESARESLRSKDTSSTWRYKKKKKKEKKKKKQIKKKKKKKKKKPTQSDLGITPVGGGNPASTFKGFLKSPYTPTS